MQVVHGYHHVDGDIPLKNMALVPEYREIMEALIIEGDWAPYFSELARLTLEAAKDHDKVVLSHATGLNSQRDHVVQKLIEGGVSEGRITLLQLTIDPIVKSRGYYHRTKRMAEQAGLSLEDFVGPIPGFEGEITEDKCVEYMVKNDSTPSTFEVHPNAIMVDVSGRDITHFDNVDAALGLTRPDDSTYESICDEVKPIDVARDAKTMNSGFFEVIAEIQAKVNPSLAIDEEGEEEKKVEEMKKRRSSIVQCEMLVRDLSNRSIGSTDETMQMRRKSLIKFGKITED